MPDWAVTLIVAVRWVAGVLLPYPPQPPIATANVKINAAIAGTGDKRTDGTVRTRHITYPNNAIAKRRPNGPIGTGIISALGFAAFGDTVTVNFVFAGPPAGVTVAGLKLQVTPVIGPQENATLPANPPVGVTVRTNCVDCPAITLPVEGAAAKEKSGLAMSMVTSAEVLPSNVPSPA